MFPNYIIFAFGVLLLQSLPNCYGIKVVYFIFYIILCLNFISLQRNMKLRVLCKVKWLPVWLIEIY